MCGRFTLTTLDLHTIASALGVPWMDPELARSWRPHYNVAPTLGHPVVRVAEGGRRMELLQWGLAGFPAGGGAKGAPLTLARSETVATSRAFREAFRTRRCVVPMDGFFEWGGERGAREPHWYATSAKTGTVPDVLFAAGIWEGLRAGGGGRFALLTVPSAGVTAEIHDRMPALLPLREVGAYLSAEVAATALAELARVEATRLGARRVGRHVNSARNDDPRCLEEASEWGDLPLFRR